MILRFRAIDRSGNPHYIAFNSALKTYTMNPDEVKRGSVIDVSMGGILHIKGETDFNGYDYTNDLHEPIEEEVPIPMF